MQEYYKILGVSENATDEEIEAAYSRLKNEYSKDRFLEGEAGNIAAKNLTKLETAYQEIKESRRNSSKQEGKEPENLEEAEKLLKAGKIAEAQIALDNISELHVQRAIAAAAKGRTTFIVAHRLSTIRDADRIVVMQNGEAVECGTYEELMAKKGAFYELKNLNDMRMRSAEAALA